MTDALEGHEGTVSIGGRIVTNFRFTDDIDGLAGEGEELAKLVKRLDKASPASGMEISAEKTKLLTNNTSASTHNRAAKKNMSRGHKVLPQDTTHLKQRPCYQRGSLCQDPAGNRTTRRPPDHC